MEWKGIAKRICGYSVLLESLLNVGGESQMADLRLNLNLGEELQRFVNGQVEVGEFDGPSAYVVALISRAKEGKEKLEELLIEGLDSGDPIPLDDKQWSRIRGEVTERLSDGQ